MLFENLTSPTFMLFACITAGPKNGMVPLRGTIPFSGSRQVFSTSTGGELKS
jgi:hypothetical protein